MEKKRRAVDRRGYSSNQLESDRICVCVYTNRYIGIICGGNEAVKLWTVSIELRLERVNANQSGLQSPMPG